MAVVIGWDQTLFIAASTPVNHSEYELAGSLRGAPVELVKCETSDLLVPASAEIVLEGFVSADPKTFEPEGPFSEYPATMQDGRRRNMPFASSASPIGTIQSFMAVSLARVPGERTKERPGHPRRSRRWHGSTWKRRVCRM